MSFVIRLCRSILGRVRPENDSVLIERLAKQNAEDVQANRRSRSPKGSVQDVKSKYQFDMVYGDDTANKMMLQ